MSFWKPADVEKLKVAVASGVLSVRYDGPPARYVTYQSLAEMRALLAEMRAELSGSPAVRRGIVCKGLR